MVWTQNYDPFGQPVLSTLVAALPIVLLLGLLATGQVSAPKAALAGLVAAILAAILVFTPPEVALPDSGGRATWAGIVLAAAAHGSAFGLLPIGWIVLSAIFLYNLTVETGKFEIVKHSILTLSDDRRIQALLIAFCFGAFIEGAAGFGTPVAISAALLMGAGFRPLHAAALALIANTSPVAFGALGTPITTLAQVTLPEGMVREVWEFQISQMAGRQLPFFSLIVPAWLVMTMAGWRGVAGVWPALLVCGGSFATVQFLVANFIGPALVDVAGGLVSLVALALFLRLWKPGRTWRFPHEEGEAGRATSLPPASPSSEAGGEGSCSTSCQLVPPVSLEAGGEGSCSTSCQLVPPVSLEAGGEGSCSTSCQLVPPVSLEAGGEVSSGQAHSIGQYPLSQLVSSWVPWVLLSLFVFLWGLTPVKKALDQFTAVEVPVPGLDRRVERVPPVVPEPKPGEELKPEEARYKFNWLSTTGTGIFLAAVLSAAWLRISPGRFLAIFARTCVRMRWPLFTIACMLALAYVTRFSGMDATLGLAFTRAGWFYPFCAPLLGWLGVALTGSDTSSNALFGSLQKVTAEGLVRNQVLPGHLSESQAVLLLVTSNSTGGVMGKMIDAQSIVVSAAATQQPGREGAILRFVFWHSLLLALLMGVLVMVQAYLWTAMIPGRAG